MAFKHSYQQIHRAAFRLANKLRYLALLTVLLPLFAQAQSMPVVVKTAKDADWQALEGLLADGLQPNASYGDGSTALHWASYHASAEAAGLLLDAGAEVNAVTDLGVTPLWLAAQNGNELITELLLRAGADPNTVLLSGESIVMTAARSGNANVLRALLAAGADPNIAATRDQTALMWAANQGHGDAVAVLIEFGADIHARSLLRTQYVKAEKEQDSHPAYKTWVEQGGNTPLIFAARAGDLRSAALLVAAGADVNQLSAFGTSAAIMAVHGGNAELLDYLLSAGAEIESSASGHTALHAAVLRGNLAAVEVLLQHGADTEATVTSSTPARRQSLDYNFHDALIGATPLWLAARFTEPRLMETLIAAGARVDTVNRVSFPAQRGLAENYIADEGEISLLMAAVGMGHRRLRLSWGTPERRAGQLGQDREAMILDAVGVALLAGVDPNLRNAEGETALDYARGRRYASVVALLEPLTTIPSAIQ